MYGSGLALFLILSFLALLHNCLCSFLPSFDADLAAPFPSRILLIYQFLCSSIISLCYVPLARSTQFMAIQGNSGLGFLRGEGDQEGEVTGGWIGEREGEAIHSLPPCPNTSGSLLLIDHPPSSQVAGSNSLLGFLALLGRASLLPVAVVVEAVTNSI